MPGVVGERVGRRVGGRLGVGLLAEPLGAQRGGDAADELLDEALEALAEGRGEDCVGRSLRLGRRRREERGEEGGRQDGGPQAAPRAGAGGGSALGVVGGLVHAGLLHLRRIPGRGSGCASFVAAGRGWGGEGPGEEGEGGGGGIGGRWIVGGRAGPDFRRRRGARDPLRDARAREWRSLVALVAWVAVLLPLPALAYTYCFDEFTVDGNDNVTCAKVCELYSNTTGEYQGYIRMDHQC